ncbi:MAG: NAD(P)/FAD-dependent oxidoreductase [Candidatus Thorarchaeota archaeon]
MQLYDLTVIGGGPAGATCARIAANAGLDVVLLEKAIHPRSKPCGGAIGPYALRILDLDISSVIDRTFHAAIVHTPAGKNVVLTSQELTGHLVKRDRFDAYLLQKAKDAGVEVIEGKEVVGIEQLRKGIRALAVGDSYKSHFLVGADGVNGISAKELGVRTKWRPEDVALCYQADVPMNQDDVTRTMTTHNSEPVIELYFGLVPWGYAWCFPKRESYSIGVGCRMDMSEQLKLAWIKHIERIERDKGVELDVSRTSFRVPLGGRVDRCIGRRSMLVGDAAGLVSPLTGEGVSFAIQSGAIAAKVAIDAVEAKSALKVVEYEKQVKTGISKELADFRMLTGILNRSPRHVELLCQIADEDPIMKEYLTNILARIRPFSELKLALGKRLVTKHPLKAVRLGLK